MGFLAGEATQGELQGELQYFNLSVTLPVSFTVHSKAQRIRHFDGNWTFPRQDFSPTRRLSGKGLSGKLGYVLSRPFLHPDSRKATLVKDQFGSLNMSPKRRRPIRTRNPFICFCGGAENARLEIERLKNAAPNYRTGKRENGLVMERRSSLNRRHT